MGKEIIMTRRELLAAATALTFISSVPKGLLSAVAQDQMPCRTPGSIGKKVSLLERTAKAARDGAYERCKTSHDFNGTYRDPQWLGPI